MVYSGYEFFTLEKNVSSPLKLGRAARKLRGRGEKNLLNDPNEQRMKTATG